MILELVAGRLIARHLGSSLYTWTSIIGIVLAGITIGNYFGGRMADRFNVRKALAVIFGISSAACVAIVILNNLVPKIVWLWQFGLPFRIFSNVTLIFLIPSTLLGMISPLVAKMALDRGLPVGRTVGDVYACGAAGSIAGTFVAGFYLIGAIGTISIIWIVSASLLVLAILYGKRLWYLYLWAVIFIAIVILGNTAVNWAQDIGSTLLLRKQADPALIYEDETQYCYVAVEQVSKNPDKRIFMEDIDPHSMIQMDDIENLQFGYFKMYAAVTHQLSANKKHLSTLTIGGGGCVFPRYVEKVWPASRIDVAEIDPGVIKAAMKAFGLSNDTSVNIHTIDARMYIDNLLEQNSGQITKYDFIFEDAFNGTTVPFQLVTREFNEKIARVLSDDGVYVINMLDVYRSGLFLGAFLNTLDKTFCDIHVLSLKISPNILCNFVIVASKHPINLANISESKSLKDINLWVLSKSEIDEVKQKAHSIIFTDDYAPVDDLLAPAALEKGRRALADSYFKQAMKLEKNNQYDKCIVQLRKVINLYPELATDAYDWIGSLLAKQGKWQEAVDAGEKAIEYNDMAEVKRSVAAIHRNVGAALQQLGKNREASAHFDKAIEGFKADLAKNPDSIKTIIAIGNAYGQKGEFAKAAECFQQAISKEPLNADSRLLFAKALVAQRLYKQAIDNLQTDIQFLNEHGQKESTAQLQDYLKYLAALNRI